MARKSIGVVFSYQKQQLLNAGHATTRKRFFMSHKKPVSQCKENHCLIPGDAGRISELAMVEQNNFLHWLAGRSFPVQFISPLA
jgi:hypothetical protein